MNMYSEFDIQTILNSREIETHDRGMLLYKTFDGKIIVTKQSVYHIKKKYYWYGITPNFINSSYLYNISHIALFLEKNSYLLLPISILLDYLNRTNVTHHKNGSIRHYHVFVKEINHQKYLIYTAGKMDVTEFDVKISRSIDSDFDLLIDRFKDESYESLLEKAKKYVSPSVSHKNVDFAKIRVESSYQKEIIKRIENYTCQVCQTKLEYKDNNGKIRYICHADHILDKSKMGDENIDNIWILCPNCHALKTYGVIKIDSKNKKVTLNGKEIVCRNKHLSFLEITHEN